MTILILDDITTAIHYLERAIATHDSGPAVELSIDHYAKVQEYADRMAAETLAVVREMRAQLTEAAPMFGQHGPGLITPRIVDNADRSGANQFKRVNATYGRGINPLVRPPAKNTTNDNAGGIFYPQLFSCHAGDQEPQRLSSAGYQVPMSPPNSLGRQGFNRAASVASM